MKKCFIVAIIAAMLTGCSGKTPSVREIAASSFHVEILDSEPIPKPGIRCSYSLSIPDMDELGNDLICRFQTRLFVDGELRETGGGSSGPSSTITDGERTVGTIGCNAFYHYSLDEIVSPGETTEVKFEVVYSVYNYNTDERLFSGIEWATKTIERN